MDIINTPSSEFNKIKDFPYQENYVGFDDMQMHYIDEGEGEILLALHGEPSWSYLYRKFVPVLADYRLIAPDLIGFGKSDKLTDWKAYSFELHYRSLKSLIDKLELKDITLIVQDWGGMLGLSLLGEFPDLFKRVVIMNTFLPVGKPMDFFFKAWVAFAKYHPSIPIGLIMQMGTHSRLSEETIAAYKAPFPSSKYKAGAKAFPSLVPKSPSDAGVAHMKRARKVLSEWTKPALILFSDKDAIMTGKEKFFYRLIPSAKAQKKIMIRDAGHFLQEEKGEEIATYIDQFIKGELER
ncbi:MAG: haloalkane dehalogenase [Cyclobacteriaceae bacterium]